MRIVLIKPERYAYEDAVSGDCLFIYLQNSRSHIITESAENFFGGDAEKLTRFLQRLGEENPTWIDVCNHCAQLVEVDLQTYALSFKSLDWEDAAKLAKFSALRDFQEFLVENCLTPASYWENWSDPTGLIIGADSYYAANDFSRVVLEIQEALNTRNLIEINGWKMAATDLLLSIFFKNYWTQGEIIWVRSVPSCAPVDFYELLLDSLEPVKERKISTLRALRKQFWQVRQQENVERLIVVVLQPLHFSNQVIDELHDLASRNLATFILVNADKKNIDRLEKLGEDEDDFSLDIGSYQNFVDFDFLHEVREKGLVLEQIPKDIPLGFREVRRAFSKASNFDSAIERIEDYEDGHPRVYGRF
jgi:hypothetical protein